MTPRTRLMRSRHKKSARPDRAEHAVPADGQRLDQSSVCSRCSSAPNFAPHAVDHRPRLGPGNVGRHPGNLDPHPGGLTGEGKVQRLLSPLPPCL